MILCISSGGRVLKHIVLIILMDGHLTAGVGVYLETRIDYVLVYLLPVGQPLPLILTSLSSFNSLHHLGR